MKLYDLGFFVFVLFVLNCAQFEKDRLRCEKSDYTEKGCSIHKKIKKV
jgi:hypothetical protein